MQKSKVALFTIILMKCAMCYRVANSINEQLDFDREEEKNKQDNDEEVTGTFVFKKASPNAGTDGWDVSGCYCRGGQPHCSCSNSDNKIKFFVAKSSKQKRKSTEKMSPVITKKPETIQAPTPIPTQAPANFESGCFCDEFGCKGSTCSSLNGCICNEKGNCWGVKCSPNRHLKHKDATTDSQTVISSENESVNPDTWFGGYRKQIYTIY